MRRILILLPVVMLSLVLIANAQLTAPGPDTSPKVGEKSPDFELPSGRTTIGLKDFAGKKKSPVDLLSSFIHRWLNDGIHRVRCKPGPLRRPEH